jgi:hypothetical protein
MLKSINAEVADESPEAIAALAKAAVGIAAMTICTPDAFCWLEECRSLKEQAEATDIQID